MPWFETTTQYFNKTGYNEMRSRLITHICNFLRLTERNPSFNVSRQNYKLQITRCSMCISLSLSFLNNSLWLNLWIFFTLALWLSLCLTLWLSLWFTLWVSVVFYSLWLSLTLSGSKRHYCDIILLALSGYMLEILAHLKSIWTNSETQNM